MKPWEQYQSAPQEAGPWTQYAIDAPKQELAETSIYDDIKRGGLDIAQRYLKTGIGAVRGIKDVIDTGADFASNLGGQEENARIKAMNAQGKAEYEEKFGSDLNAQGGRLAGNVAITMPVGGLLAKGAASVPMLAKYAPALASGGFKLGGAGGGLLANTAIRAGAGATTGAIQAGMIDPSSAGFGLAVGGALPVAAKGIGLAGRAIGKAAAPMTESGRARIISDFLKSRLGDKADEVIANLEANKGKTPGFTPTTGQAAGNADLATLGRVFSERNPGVFQDRLSGQREALANSVRSMGGDETAIANLVDSRSSAADALYGKAMNSDQMRIDVAKQATDAQKPGFLAVGGEPTQDMAYEGLRALQTRPQFQKAVNDAKQLMLNNGVNVDPLTSLQGLHYIKLALDDIISKGSNPVSGIGKNELGAYMGIKDKLMGEIDQISPLYGNARQNFADMSKPINQMDLGNAIADKYIPAIYRDVPIPGQLNHAKLAAVLHDLGDGMAKKATNFKGATLKNTLSPEQMKKLTDALSDSQLIVNGQRSGAPVNSSTFQNLAFNADMEPSALGGLLTKFGPVSRIAGLLGGGRDVLYGSANKKITGLLGDALADPEVAKGLLSLPAKRRKEVVSALLGNPAFRALATEASAQ